MICRLGGEQEEGETRGGRSASPIDNGRESKAQWLEWSLGVREQEIRLRLRRIWDVSWIQKKNHAERIFLIVSHSRTCGKTSWRYTHSSMLSHAAALRRECFLVITLPAVENKRSEAAEVAGIASTRLTKTPNPGKKCPAPRCHSSTGFLSLGKGFVQVFHILISLSALVYWRSSVVTPWSSKLIFCQTATGSLRSWLGLPYNLWENSQLLCSVPWDTPTTTPITNITQDSTLSHNEFALCLQLLLRPSSALSPCDFATCLRALIPSPIPACLRSLSRPSLTLSPSEFQTLCMRALTPTPVPAGLGTRQAQGRQPRSRRAPQESDQSSYGSLFFFFDFCWKIWDWT